MEIKTVAHEAAIAECVTDVLSHFDVLCDLLLNSRTAPWNLFVLYKKNDVIYTRVTQLIITKSQSKFENMTHYIIPVFVVRNMNIVHQKRVRCYSCVDDLSHGQ